MSGGAGPGLSRRSALLAGAAALACSGAAGAAAPGAAGFTFWCGTLRNKSLAERLAAMRAGGFRTLSIAPLDYVSALNSGLSARDIRAMAADAGVAMDILDPFTKWLPTWEPPPQFTRDQLAFLDFDEDDFFRIGEALQIRSLSVIHPFQTRYPAEQAADSFGRLCDRAARNGWRVHLEFMPTGGVPDLAAGWEIVRRAARPNGGLVLDTWHYFRGRPDAALLASIPGDRIFELQLSDGGPTVVGNLFEDMMRHRRAPGEGAFDLEGVVRILRRTGGLGSVGVEVFAAEYDGLPADEVARHTGETMRAVLARGLG